VPEILKNRMTVTLCQDLLEEKPAITSAKNKTRAVISAIQQCIKRQKLETIKNPAGQRNWQEVVKVQEMKARLDIAPSAPVFLDTPVWQSNFLKKRGTVQEVNRTKNSLGLNLNFYPTRRKKD